MAFYNLQMIEYLRYSVKVDEEKIGEIRMEAEGGPLFHYKSEAHPEERTTHEIGIAARTLLKEAIERKQRIQEHPVQTKTISVEEAFNRPKEEGKE